MLGSNFSSELVDCSQFQENKLNIIKAPTGCGKSYFALREIPKLTNDSQHKIVYLIDTINGKNQIINNYDAILEYWGWKDEVYAASSGIDFKNYEYVVVMTYARFGNILAENPDFHKNFEYIICDELHSLIKFQNFSEKPNCHSIAKAGLERAVKYGKTKVIALSATPERIEKFFWAPYYEIPVDQESLIRFETHEIIPFTNLAYVISSIEAGKKGLCYTGHISQMLNLEQIAKERGFNPICIWSTKNPTYTMSEKQLAVRETVLKQCIVPEEYDLLIINSSCETSIKIKSPMDFVLVNSTNRDTQIQVRGRVNSDLDILYRPASTNDDIVVPEEFLGTRLFREEKVRLCEVLNLRSPHKRQYSWNTVRERLIDSDYVITDGRIGSSGNRYVIITQAS